MNIILKEHKWPFFQIISSGFQLKKKNLNLVVSNSPPGQTSLSPVLDSHQSGSANDKIPLRHTKLVLHTPPGSSVKCSKDSSQMSVIGYLIEQWRESKPHPPL